MGCCASTNRSPPSSPYGNTTPPGLAGANDSRAPIATTTSAQQTSASSISPSAVVIAPVSSHSQSQIQPSAGRRHHNNASQQPSQSSTFTHPTQPLKPPPKSSKIPPPPSHSIDPSSPIPRLTHATLLRERTAFFDTRVAGHPEVWAAVRLICEMLERGERGEAQAVMEAAGCTCPSGEIWGRRGGIWDERGERYAVPAWCVGVPKGTVNVDGNEQEGDGSAPEDEGESSDDDGEGLDGKKKVRLEKGKGRAVEVEKDEEEIVRSGEVKVRVRLSTTARDFVVKARVDNKVYALVRKVREVCEVPPDIKIKIGYLGRILHENDSLAAQGWVEGHTLNVYVFA